MPRGKPLVKTKPVLERLVALAEAASRSGQKMRPDQHNELMELAYIANMILHHRKHRPNLNLEDVE